MARRSYKVRESDWTERFFGGRGDYVCEGKEEGGFFQPSKYEIGDGNTPSAAKKKARKKLDKNK